MEKQGKKNGSKIWGIGLYQEKDTGVCPCQFGNANVVTKSVAQALAN